jgi:hypothetical protein
MHFDAGPYRLTLPPAAQFPHPSERAPPHRVVPDFRLGPFEVTARLSAGTLQDWRDHLNWTTKGGARVTPLAVNGIPGLTLEPVSEAQRLDYTFQSPDHPRIEIVAWSDTPTSADEQQLIQAAVSTLHHPPVRLTIVGGGRETR